MKALALLLLGTLTGNELAVGAFVHPTISRLSDDKHAASAQGLARIYGKYAPFWYLATIISLIVLAWRTPSGESEKPLFVGSAALMLAALGLTIVAEVPINNRVCNWNLDELPANWKAERSQWDKLNAIRVAILFGSLIALALGATRK